MPTSALKLAVFIVIRQLSPTAMIPIDVIVRVALLNLAASSFDHDASDVA